MGQRPSSVSSVRWDWQSNSNPFSKEPVQWTAYPPEINKLIEKSYLNQKKMVDIGEYTIHFKEKIQINNKNSMKQRMVRRIEEESKIIDDSENARAKRFFGCETPKTMNRPYGELENMLTFIENRSTENKEFAKFFREAESKKDFGILNKHIVSLIIKAIKRRASNIQLKNKSQALKAMADEKILCKIFDRRFISFQDFYRVVLNAYTKETFLYHHLNSLLRNEDWSELDDLMPYLYSLVKAFISSGLGLQFHSLPSLEPKKVSESIILYRGASLDESATSWYETLNIKYFSWNAVTSTSKNPEKTKLFMKQNKIDSKKLPVLFIIESPQYDPNTKSMIDVKEFSDYPEEEEIILAPGTIFELIACERKEDHVEIKLKVMTDLDQLRSKGIMFYGAVHSEVVKAGEIAEIEGFEGKQLEEAISHLKGNKLIKEVVLSACVVKEETINLLEEVLKLAQLQAIALRDIQWSNECFNLFLKSTYLKKVNKFEYRDGQFSDKASMIFSNGLAKMSLLRTLNLNLRSCNQFADSGLTNLSKALQSLTSLISLNLNCHACSELTEAGLSSLSQALKSLTSITYLTLNFGHCKKINCTSLTSLSKAIKSLSSLKGLSMNFLECSKINDSALTDLSQVIEKLSSLVNLDLNFGTCKGLTDSGIKTLSHNISSLSKLKGLNINFNRCGLTDSALATFSQEIRSFTLLTTLSVDFGWCDKMTDSKLLDLSFTITTLPSLKDLGIGFSGCTRISDSGLADFFQTFKSLPPIASLMLDFSGVFKLLDSGIAKLSQILQTLKSLTHLGLEFSDCDKITDSGLTSLSQGIMSLPKLAHLKLNFSIFYYSSSQISDSGLASLAFVMRSISQLTNVNFHFEKCTKITEFGIANLAQAIKSLSSLASCTFNGKELILTKTNPVNKALEKKSFSQMKFKRQVTLNGENNDKFQQILSELRDPEILKTNEKPLEDILHLLSLNGDNPPFQVTFYKGTEDLTRISKELFQELASLTSLTYLNISYSECKEMDDSDLLYLSKAIKSLTSLKHLNLNFSECNKLSDSGLSTFSQAIVSLRSLTSLNINLSISDFQTPRLTDSGLSTLFYASQNLVSLRNLNLNLYNCYHMTDTGMASLSQALKSLPSLISLNLDISRIEKITNSGLATLADAIQTLTLLTKLSLSFNRYTNITDSGVSQFSKTFKFLPALTSLEVNFDSCELISDSGLTNFSKGIISLPSLVHLSLNFQWCEKLTDLGLSNLSQQFKDLIFLSSLSLNFEYCPLVSDGGCQAFSKTLKYWNFIQES